MASKKSKQGNQTNPTFVVGRVYLRTHKDENDDVVPDGFARYIGPSATYPGEHILEDGTGDLNYCSASEIEIV